MLRPASPPGTSPTRWPKATRPVIVRDDEIAHGYFELDPCNLSDGEAEEITERIVGELRSAQAASRTSSLHSEWAARHLAARLAWPDRFD